MEGTLNSKTYDTVHSRLTVEEATVSVTDAGGLQGITMKDSDEEEGWFYFTKHSELGGDGLRVGFIFGVFWQLVLVIAFIVLPYDIGAEM